jgi:alanine-alpha-ketoisovalerate/valine-pyruvate aminotransferase
MDLPFGMAVTTYYSLEELYTSACQFISNYLKPCGYASIITSQEHLLEEIISHFSVDIDKKYSLCTVTSRNSYLYLFIYLIRRSG